MSDIHILTGSFRGNGHGRYEVVYHVPVGAGLNYPQDAERTSVVPNISGQELAGITGGTLAEVVESYDTNSAIDVAEAQNWIRNRWHEVAAETLARVADQYRFFGTTLSRS